MLSLPNPCVVDEQVVLNHNVTPILPQGLNFWKKSLDKAEKQAGKIKIPAR
jgi:hypothetical protein